MDEREVIEIKQAATLGDNHKNSKNSPIAINDKTGLNIPSYYLIFFRHYVGRISNCLYLCERGIQEFPKSHSTK